ncbi:hypothetical protein [Pseudomonas japonica]|uniref:Abortive infection C-terminus n=1 Tax=Pseudomonas japonica TaxID=256466 RepID=A0A239I537_9PSED|nr:hypothetical protein [Pseudomonas japonica]SNS88183.1 hypothetical protein SAMN05444352_11799 [Pseudomonas japonica]
MSDDEFAELAIRSARVKNENLQLLHGLRAFEQKLLDLVQGLGCSGNSETIAFDEILDQEEEPIGRTACYLAFTGRELKIGWKEVPRPSEYDYWTLCSLEDAGTDMQRRVSDPKILSSLVADLLQNLDKEFSKTAYVVQSLAQFVTVEKAEIDADLDGLFSGNSMLLDSWLKARKLVLPDPDQSISLSCTHIETVLKGCLKLLGEEGYDHYPVEKLFKRLLGVLRGSSIIGPASSEMLQGVGTMFHGIGTLRNETSHGKNDGYVAHPPELAQTLNHLAGVASVFLMKQTDLALKNR